MSLTRSGPCFTARTLITPERAAKIQVAIYIANGWLSGGMVTDEEDAEIHRVWNTLPSGSSYYDAVCYLAKDAMKAAKSKPQVTKKQVVALVKLLGGTITISPSATGGLDVEIDTPPKKVWKGTDLHCVVGNTYTKSGIQALWESLYDDVKDGLESCDQQGCGYCSEET